MSQSIRENPTEPAEERMEEGVAKIPVPIMRLKIRRVADGMPRVRRFDGSESSSMVRDFSGSRVDEDILDMVAK